jgi:hypothetical protein
MKCEEIRERMLDVAAGLAKPTADETKHIATCAACAEQWKSLRSTMTLLDEWRTPEPSPYFDVRLQARLREEMTKVPSGWRYWLRRPVLAAALTVLMGLGVGLFFTHDNGMYYPGEQASNSELTEPGSAVSDLQSLDNNHDLLSDFELLDDLDVQPNVSANP